MTANSELFCEAPIAEQMRDGLRRLGKAVVVITALYNGQRWAMTATAVSELSMDPPSLLVCVNKAASLYGPLSAGSNFCVNILSANQAEISQSCFGATKGEERFRLGQWDSAACGTPLLRESQASFVCEYRDMVEFGTHAIVIGEVSEVRVTGTPDPLIYLNGGYGKVSALGA
ncbi:flavin reductase family protein [Novosphingobium aquimarinum]|uniref:flavin reductase family protein n=1 Tax=Novosphingobium aquimarinum TaxID=2682494 RepID=UPI0018DC5FC3|nr:flavin reductase family protein [Novosphingobium aquimarinum]